MTDQITLKCSSCGSTKFRVPSNAQPADIIKCAGCGAQRRYDILQRQATDAAKEMVTNMFRDAFRGVKGFTIK
jgi:uncharacterized Zn finger protein